MSNMTKKELNETKQAELEQQVWFATSEVINLIKLINELPPEHSRQIKDLFNRIENRGEQDE